MQATLLMKVLLSKIEALVSLKLRKLGDASIVQAGNLTHVLSKEAEAAKRGLLTLRAVSLKQSLKQV